ncbi:MAG: stage 0 sporulation protein [Bacilli bacterium]|nr:stage 0 sporulation protein [Bacilli bacterium]
MINYYGVTFKDDGKVYYFKTEEIECPLNVTVIVETEKGLQFGKVVSKVEKIKGIDKDSIKDIIRISTKEDYNQYLKNIKDAKEAISYANNCINDLELNMNIIDASFTFDRKQLIISFISDERVDFRELAKMLAGKYHTRIELRQVGARDKAKKVGGIGICGKELCCKQFLNSMQSVTINMAKNQNIALNPSKINGSCGRLLCCLNYEDEEYRKCLNGMPNVGQVVKTPFGEGNVISLDILNRKYKVSVNNDIKEIELDK